jgi:hypothetical protein
MVRKIYICMILTLSIASLCSAQDISGKWKGKMQGPDGDMEMMFNFKVNADTLNGTAESPMGELPISNGKVKGQEFAFDISFNEMTIHHDCKLMADSIVMKVPGMGGEAMEIILKRSADKK